MSDLKMKAARKETRRFGLVGFVATVIDYTIFNTLVGLFHLPIIMGNVVSTSTGSVVSYLLNRQVVFDGDRHDSRRKTLLLYVAIIATGIYGIQSVVLYVVHMELPQLGNTVHEALVGIGITGISDHVAQTNTAKVCASFISAIWNFLMLRRFVFVPLTHNPEKHVE